MIISKITLYNYRLYRGLNTIEFPTDNNRNVFLVSGENGFGKTTFLHSLMWCLYGKLITEVEADVRKDISANGYNAFLKAGLNNEVKQTLTDDEKNGEYYVQIDFSEVVIPSLPCTSLSVKRRYNYRQEKESVEILVDGRPNKLADEIGSSIFINDFILNKDIARFFFFDSEQIVALAETNKLSERQKLCSAYNEVLGLRKYEDLKRTLDNVRLRFRKKSNDAELRDKLLLQLDRKIELEKLIEEKKAAIADLETELLAMRQRDEEMRTQLLREGNDATTEELKRLESVIAITKKRHEEYKSKLKVFLDYAPFAIAGKLFKETKEQIEKDNQQIETYNNQVSRNLVVSDITSDLLLMLQRLPVDNVVSMQLQDEIQTILEKYKGDVSLSNSLLAMSSNDFDELIAVYDNVVSTYRVEFEHLAENYKKNKQVWERNSKRLSNITSKENDELIKQMRIKKTKLENDIAEKDNEVKQAYELIGTKNEELRIVLKRISELSKVVSLDALDGKKDELAQQLSGELAEFLVTLKQEKKVSLERRIKDILNTLMHKEDFIDQVKVVIVDDTMDIELYSADGNEINKDSLSKGEQQLYATSILKALVDESGIEFPVFIDSPLQKFDKSHASKIITEFYPNISRQVVLFPLLHKELDAEEYELMQPMVKATYKIQNETGHSVIREIPIDQFM